MSDFDEEAERERLREQYEQEQRKREATEHMSDLLLKGATMTDSHCDNCGDPIFRYDGQEFCPTCQQQVGEGENQGGEAGAQPSQENATAEAADGDATTAKSQAQPPADPEADNAPDAAKTTQPGEDTPDVRESEPPSGPDTVAGDAARATDTTDTERVQVPTVSPDQREREAPSGSLGDARTSLEAALTTFSRQAAATEDPRQAQDALEAAREAAEALAALDQVR